MTYIAYDNLYDILEQDILSPDDTYITRVSLNLLKCLEPAGTFTVSIIDAYDNVLGSKSQTLAEMQAEGSDALSEDYYHGFISFEFDSPVHVGFGTYYIRLEASGYTYTDEAYIGWLRDWEHKLVNNTEEAASSVNEPFAYRIYSLRR